MAKVYFLSTNHDRDPPRRSNSDHLRPFVPFLPKKLGNRKESIRKTLGLRRLDFDDKRLVPTPTPTPRPQLLPLYLFSIPIPRLLSVSVFTFSLAEGTKGVGESFLLEAREYLEV